MKVSAWMVAGSVACWLIGSRLVAPELTPDIGFGMLGPLVAAVGTWMAISTGAEKHPTLVTQRLLLGLFVKALFFAGYVVAMVRVVHVRPVPFVVSFTIFFLGLLVIEALLLRRLGLQPISTTRA